MALTKIDTAMIAEGAIDAGKIANTVALGGPKITGLDYPGDDTAALPAGGQTIIVNGDNFQSGCTVYVDGTVISVVSFLSESQLQFVAPAKATGLYAFYVVNPDGGTAILVPGMVYSGTPTWTTASGSLGTPYETAAVSVNFSATGDGALTYAVTSGSSLPTGLSLSSAGALTGTVPATAADTTYTFNVDVIDSENQSTTRQFSLTYRTDVVTWSSPADSASFTWDAGQSNSTSLVATSAAGKSVSFAVQSGSLPANVTVSGNSISGNPTTGQSNTSVIIRATAADTNRYADRTLYFTINTEPALGSSYGGGYYAGRYALGGNLYRIIVAPKATGQSYRQIATSSGARASGVTLEQTRSDGWTVTNAQVSSGSWSAANWARGLTIGGYNDWYIPSTWEMCLAFATFKPTFTNNDTESGSNVYTRTPGWPANTAFGTSNPARTSITAFQGTNSEAFTYGSASNGQLYYVTYRSNESSSAYTVGFDNEGSAGRGLSNSGYWSVSITEALLVRVIRRELIGAE